MAAISIGSHTATIPTIPVRASVARTALQSVLELVAVFLLATLVPITGAFLLPAILLFLSAAVLLVAVAFSGETNRLTRVLEIGNATLLAVLLVGSALAR